MASDEIKKRRLAELLGIPYVPEPEPEPADLLAQADASREAEAVIAWHTNPTGFKTVNCRICHRDFAINRANISCCSDKCRKALLLEFGIENWNPTGRTPEERWTTQSGGPEPLIVPPTLLETRNHETLAETLESVPVA